ACGLVPVVGFGEHIVIGIATPHLRTDARHQRSRRSAAAANPMTPTSASDPGASSGGPITMLYSGSRKPPGLRATPRTCVITPIKPSRQYSAESAGSQVRAARSERKPATAATLSAGDSATGVHIHLSPNDPRKCSK